jgi:hypothetical protein
MFGKRLKSSSLIEVIVSLIIFSIIFGIAISVVFRLNGKKEALTIEARTVLNKVLCQTKLEKSFVNENMEISNYAITKEIVVLDESAIKLIVSAFRDEKKVDEIYEIVSSK